MLICTRKSGCMKLGGHNGDCEVQSRGEYTPTTDEMRFAWAERVNKHDQEGSDEFDRWLVEVERAAAARALAEVRSTIGAYQEHGVWAFDQAVACIERARAAEIRERKSE